MAFSAAFFRPIAAASRVSRHSRAFGILQQNAPPPMGPPTKIVCTIGPATDQPAQIAELIATGMSVIRLNFSHSGDDYSYPESIIDMVRKTPGKYCCPAITDTHDSTNPRNLRAILVDTKGPEIRTGILQGSADIMEIEVGNTIELTTHDVSADEVSSGGSLRLNVDYRSIARTVQVGGQILLDDGLIALEVVTIDPKEEFVMCTALNAGPIKKNKGVNLPGVELDLPALTDKDKKDLKWACEVEADFVAASFIRTGGNVRSVVAYLNRCIVELGEGDRNHMPMRPLVISKIESEEGVDNFHEILAESDGIMVARGDLGVEIPYYKVFAAQKMMVKACNDAGKPVIVATQMLDSMMRNPRPTRAEVTDVGSAVLDGADAVMLSGETAAGKYPLESLKAMGKVVWEADQLAASKHIRFSDELHMSMNPLDQELDAVAASACRAAIRMKAKLIVLISMEGKVARAVARHNAGIPVLAFCTDPQVGRRLQLHRSITPIILSSVLDPDCKTTRMGSLRAEAARTAKELGFARAGDRIVMVDRTAGKHSDMFEFAHNMKVVTLKDS